MYSEILKKEIAFKNEGFEGLNVFRLSFRLAMEIYEVTKSFPKVENYSLTDQMRRSARSICANIGEGYRKKRYPKLFVSKMIDADGESAETLIHLKFSCECKYIDDKLYVYFIKSYDEVARMLNGIISHPEKFTLSK